jgi:DNA-directed RNA polymerase I, II, and III subunit RPABC1
MESYNSKELLNILINNIEKMLQRRKLIKKLTEKYIDQLKVDKMIYIDEPNKVSISIINNTVTNIASGSNIDDYCSKKLDYKKFIFVKSFNKKVFKQIKANYKNVEIFFIHEFYEDIPDKDIIPEHILLNEDEKTELLKSFKITELSKIYNTDMMSRYYGANVNNIFKIKRYNINSGISTSYRAVINGSVDILFI